MTREEFDALDEDEKWEWLILHIPILGAPPCDCRWCRALDRKRAEVKELQALADGRGAERDRLELENRRLQGNNRFLAGRVMALEEELEG